MVSLDAAEGPFARAFDDKCRSVGDIKDIKDIKCRRIASARTAPFDRIELHEAVDSAYVVVQHAGQWFVGARITQFRARAATRSQCPDARTTRLRDRSALTRERRAQRCSGRCQSAVAPLGVPSPVGPS